MNIDKKIHDVFDYFNGKEIRWRDFQEVGVEEYYYDFYYAEDCLYVIRDRIYEKYYFVETRINYIKHFRKLMNKEKEKTLITFLIIWRKVVLKI